MMKKRILKLSCFGLIFMLFLSGAAGFLKVNSLPDSVRIKGFYLEPKDSLNMVTIGASETYTAIAPGLLWKEFGFTSYNYSVAGSPISIVKSQVKEILANQDPKVIVIEINGTLQDDEYQINEGDSTRRSADRVFHTFFKVSFKLAESGFVHS